MKFLVSAFGESVFNKIAVAVANCDHQNSKLRRVAGAEGFWVSGLRVQQLKIGRKSCFGNFSGFYTYLAFAYENLTTFGNYKSGNTGMKPLSLSATRHDFPVPTPRRCTVVQNGWNPPKNIYLQWIHEYFKLSFSKFTWFPFPFIVCGLFSKCVKMLQA